MMEKLDQDKPTESREDLERHGEQPLGWKSDQYKQEWTARTVMDIAGDTFNGAWDVANAHNAALAAARENTFAAQQSAFKEGIRAGELEKQLADERSLRETAQSNAELWHEEMMKTDKRLAAERQQWKTGQTPMSIEEIHERIQKGMSDARKTPEYKQEGLELENHQLREQLKDSEATAERFRREIGEVGIAAAKVAQENMQLREQLAAERAQLAMERAKVAEYERNEDKSVRELLAAEQKMKWELAEKVQQLVDALKEAREVIAEEYGATVASGSPLIHRIDAALEKVGKMSKKKYQI